MELTSSHPRGKKSSKATLIALAFLVWLGVSAAFLVVAWETPELAIQGDDYWAMSRWFETGGPYPYSHFGPGYPFLIYVLSSAGVTMFGLLVVQKLMVAAIGLCVHGIARLLSLPFGLSLGAGLVVAVAPLTQGISSTIFSETLYVLLVAIATLLFVGARSAGRHPQWTWLLASFALLGLAALVRGNALVLLAGYGLVGFFFFRPRHVVLSLVVASLPVLGWSAMNYEWYGHFKPTSSGDANIADSLVGPVMIELEGKPEPANVASWMGPDWRDTYPNLFEVSAATRGMAIEYALDHPVPVVIGNVKGWLHSMLGPGRADIEVFLGKAAPPVVALSVAVRAALLLGVVGFVVLGVWRRQPVFAVMLAVALVAYILTSGAAGYARFGFPMDMFSAVALALVLRDLAGRRGQRRIAAPGGPPRPLRA